MGYRWASSIHAPQISTLAIHYAAGKTLHMTIGTYVRNEVALACTSLYIAQEKRSPLHTVKHPHRTPISQCLPTTTSPFPAAATERLETHRLI